MTNCSQRLTAVLIILFVAFTPTLKAQQLTAKETNYVHDRMYDLMAKSNAVSLPASLTEQLESINKDNPNKQKIISGQSSLLKVMYNTALTKDDIRFFGNQLLQSKSTLFAAIQTLVKEKMKNL